MICLTIPRPEVDSKTLRERELTARLADLDGELSQLEHEIAEFRCSHFGIAESGNVFILAASVAAPSTIHIQALALAQRLDRIRSDRDAVLHELAYL